MGKLVERIYVSISNPNKKQQPWFDTLCRIHTESVPRDSIGLSSISLVDWINSQSIGVAAEEKLTPSKMPHRTCNGVEYKFRFESEAAKTMFMLKYA